MDIVILQPDKGNGVVILHRTAYDRGIPNIINDTSKFKPLSHDPTLVRGKKLQRFLRTSVTRYIGVGLNLLGYTLYQTCTNPGRPTSHLLFVRLCPP